MIKGSNAMKLHEVSKKIFKETIKMLYSFLTSLVDYLSFLNVFKYITFRIGLSVVTSLIIVFLIGNPLIKYFSKKQITGPIRQDGPIDHIIKKTGTPTMGGLMILIGIIVSTLNVGGLKKYLHMDSTFCLYQPWVARFCRRLFKN